MLYFFHSYKCILNVIHCRSKSNRLYTIRYIQGYRANEKILIGKNIGIILSLIGKI